LLELRETITLDDNHSAPDPALRGLQHACLAAKVCDDLRGKDTLVLDLTGITPLFDYFVITTGTSRRQMHAIADEVDRVLKEHGSRRMGLEGYESGTWIVQDYGDVVLHVFNPDARSLYDLEHLWADAARVEWEEVAADYLEDFESRSV
jgi:ribosome-associated protein